MYIQAWKAVVPLKRGNMCEMRTTLAKDMPVVVMWLTQVTHNRNQPNSCPGWHLLLFGFFLLVRGDAVGAVVVAAAADTDLLLLAGRSGLLIVSVHTSGHDVTDRLSQLPRCSACLRAWETLP